LGGGEALPGGGQIGGEADGELIGEGAGGGLGELGRAGGQVLDGFEVVGANWFSIGVHVHILIFSFFVQLDHTFEKVPSHGGKQLDFSLFAEVAGVEGFAWKK
jgi:hypothetical protein